MTHVQLVWINTQSPQDRGVMLSELPVHIGRTAANNLCIGSRECGVSREHARITDNFGRIMLEDLDSLNGTYINNRRVTREPIDFGTRFHLGSYQISLHIATCCTNPSCRKPLPPTATICRWCGQFSADAATQHLS